MKVLIVDDENHVREAIRLLVDWEKLGVNTIMEASDVLTAMDIVHRGSPQIIITDIVMPVKNGIEFMAWLKLHALKSKIIVVSGHSDFEFVRCTVQYGGTDYILKPIIKEHIQEAVDKAIKSWRTEDSEFRTNMLRKVELKKLRPIYQEKILNTLITASEDIDPIKQQLAQEMPYAAGVKSCKVAVINMDSIGHEVSRNYLSNKNVLAAHIVDECNEYFEVSKQGVAFKNQSNVSEIVLLFWNHLKSAETVAGILNDKIRKRIGSRVDICLSEEGNFPEGISQAYERSRSLFDERNLLVESKGVHTAENGTLNKTGFVYWNSLEATMHAVLYSGKHERIVDLVDRWIKELSKDGHITYSMMKLWRDHFCSFILSTLNEAGVDEKKTTDLVNRMSKFSFPLDEHGKLLLSVMKEDILEILIEVSNRISCNLNDNGSIFDDIARYIEQHYNKDLTLQYISEHFYLSREHISRKFKQEFNMNFTEYLCSVRIDKAKILLCNPVLKIYIIAQMVGYNDEKYFSKVFKIKEGISPYEYRSLLHPN